MKNIINIVWVVIILLYNWLFVINWIFGLFNFNFINIENVVFNNLENKVNIKYNVFIFLVLVEVNYFFIFIDIWDFKLFFFILIYIDIV